MEKTIVIMEAMTAQPAYRLITIEEEQVPLAATPFATGYMAMTVAVMVLLAALLLLAAYLFRCSRYRRRIRELEPDAEPPKSWNIRKLKATIDELEEKKVEESLRDIPYGAGSLYT